MPLRLLIVISICFIAVGTKHFCNKEIYEIKFHTKKYNETAVKIDALAIGSPNSGTIFQFPGLCSASTGLPFQRKCEDTEKNNTVFSKNPQDIERVELLDCKKISVIKQCKEESFKHYYIKKNNVTSKSTNKWPTTNMGEFAMPINICLNTSGVALRRKCSYNNKTYSAEWEKLESKIKCLKDIKESIVTEDLNTLYQEVKKENETATVDSVDITTRLTNILTRKNTQRIASDLDISTNILEMLTFGGKTETVASRVVGITNLLMQADESAVLNSQATNAPNNLLRTVETYFDDMTNVFTPNTTDCSTLMDGVKYFIENSTSVFYIYPACNNVSGIGVYSKSSGRPEMRYDNHTNTHFKYLYLNESLDDVVKEANIIAAVYFPQSVWNELSNKYSRNDKKFLGLRISLYKNQIFFIGRNNEIPKSFVLKVSVPGYTDQLPGYIPYIFHNTQPEKKDAVQCGTFNFDFWSLVKMKINAENVAVCETKNLHFGCLIGHKSKKHKINDVLSIIVGYSQDIITIVGCLLSLAGLSAIWLTALCCRQWRKNPANLLSLNICLVLTLLMAYFLFINVTEMRQNFLKKFNLDYCFVEGAFLQYSILVLFVWMLIIGIQQYRKLASVYDYRNVSRMDNVLYILCAWGLPVLPTLLVWCLDSNSYVPISESVSINSDICYPSGWSFYFGIFIPMVIICTINICIFLYIIYRLRCTNTIDYRHNKDGRDFILHLRISILLFFVLGVSWLFGILAHMQENTVLSCLFCLTSTLQGFVLFVYFVIIDKTTSSDWLNCCCGKDYYITEDTSTALNSFKK
ncbi:adhesion G-protein coupled receptor G2-like [Musca autumnalis]|uniref:adhesion G-protein coupled receptor G2-like n=1 Tax=Musca autumnalis TaxID=221902 RepID=UPI003CEDB2DC